MHAALPSEGAGGDQDRHIMSRSIHPHRQCRSPAPVISPARRRLAGRCENDRIDAADGLAARGAIAIDSLGASSPSDEPLPAARRRPQQGGGNVEITIALAVLPCPTSRGFLPRRLSDAGPIPVAVLAAGPASEILHDCGLHGSLGNRQLWTNLGSRGLAGRARNEVHSCRNSKNVIRGSRCSRLPPAAYAAAWAIERRSPDHAQ